MKQNLNTTKEICLILREKFYVLLTVSLEEKNFFPKKNTFQKELPFQTS